MKKQTRINFKYGIIGFFIAGLSFGSVGGYLLFSSLVSLLSVKEKLEISIIIGLFLFLLFGLIGTLAALSDAPIIEEEV
ncbi:hypothetical protein EFE32_12930 [Lactococcus lactis subsp. lactis]|uniref:hypothetical protein n=1 Tax=Lactococcus lactis TaxID=1358 RepID=UPI00223BE8F8|nr:hypothetical protein [Lactococcus lactis]MCT0017675.1 hypothetical protein [Lactococcus lactis subsp. lactis]